MKADTKESRTRADLGRTNRRAVLAEVVLNGPLPRTEIARATGLTTASVSRITRGLIEAGLLTELDEDRPSGDGRGPGRRFVRLDVDPKGGYVLGIGVNVFSQSVSLADLKNRRLARMDLKLSDFTDPDQVIERLAGEARTMIDAHVDNPDRLLGAGISITGTVNPAEGTVETSPYLGWGRIPLGKRLADALGMPVYVESQPNVQALAETRFGIARGMDSILLTNCNLGIGGCLLINGRVTRGRDFRAGMIGTTVPPGTAPLNLDETAGGLSIIRRLHQDRLDLAALRPDEQADLLLDSLEAARAGDEAALRAVAEAGRVMGETLSQMVGFLQPDAVMLTGPVASATDAYADACRQAVYAYAANRDTDILVGHMTAQAAARWLAIGEFLLERDQNLAGLKMSKAA